MHIKLCKQDFFYAFKSISRLEQNAFGHYNCCLSVLFQAFHKVLQKQQLGSISLYREVLLYLWLFLATKGRIGYNHIVAVLLLKIADIGRQRVLFVQVGTFNAVKNHIHHAHNIGQWGFFVAKESIFVQKLPLLGG